MLYQFYRLLRGHGAHSDSDQPVAHEFGVLLRLLRVSLTGILQFAIADVSWIGLVRIVSTVWLGRAGQLYDCDSHC